jgi:hypothetical protein
VISSTPEDIEEFDNEFEKKTSLYLSGNVDLLKLARSKKDRTSAPSSKKESSKKDQENMG